MTQLAGKRVAILATHGFEESELTAPRDALKNAGADVEVVSPERGTIQGFRHFEKGEQIPVQRSLEDALGVHYDALVIPGGLFNPDQLRVDDKALHFTRQFFEAGKPVGSICHGPWVLVNAKCVKGREMTAVKTIHADLINAGAKVIDKAVVVDEGLVTSRTPDDLDAFCAKLVEEVARGRRPGQQRPSPGKGAGPATPQVVS